MSNDEQELDALIERRDALSAKLAAIRRDVARGLDADSGERAVELENADVLDEIARVTCRQLDAIEEQIARARRAH